MNEVQKVSLQVLTVFLAVCVVLALLMTAFFHVWFGMAPTEPPDMETQEQLLLENMEDVQTVVDFMVASGHENIYINDPDGTMLADLEDVKIPDAAVKAAVDDLLRTGVYYSISKRGNTIVFLQWTSTREMSCGVAYSINGEDLPQVPYVTELTEMSRAGWYYYVEDYNKWRVENQTVPGK